MDCSLQSRAFFGLCQNLELFHTAGVSISGFYFIMQCIPPTKVHWAVACHWVTFEFIFVDAEKTNPAFSKNLKHPDCALVLKTWIQLLQGIWLQAEVVVEFCVEKIFLQQLFSCWSSMLIFRPQSIPKNIKFVSSRNTIWRTFGKNARWQAKNAK